MTGVSPAYFLSRCGPGFGPEDIVSGLPFLAQTGYKAFQAEVFLDAALPLWTETATKAVADSALSNGLHCSVFVAHFLGTVFSTSAQLCRGLPMDQARALVAIAASLMSSMPSLAAGNKDDSTGTDQVFVVPVPAYAWPSTLEAGKQQDPDSMSRFRGILENLQMLCREAKLRLALELLPGNILGGSAAFMDLATEPGFEDLGLLLDTGHFQVMGEAVPELARTLGSRIVATHLCDNDGITNLSLCPGDGSIPFPATIRALGKAGYRGSMDIEIVCPRESVETEYRRAYSRIKELSGKPCTESNGRMTSMMNPDREHLAGYKAKPQSYKESP